MPDQSTWPVDRLLAPMPNIGRPRWVIDLGAGWDAGAFAADVASMGYRVVAVEHDPLAMARVYQRVDSVSAVDRLYPILAAASNKCSPSAPIATYPAKRVVAASTITVDLIVSRYEIETVHLLRFCAGYQNWPAISGCGLSPWNLERCRIICGVVVPITGWGETAEDLRKYLVEPDLWRDARARYVGLPEGGFVWRRKCGFCEQRRQAAMEGQSYVGP